MPRRDGTGPYGGGPATGRGFGYCVNGEQPNAMPRFGRRSARGRGNGPYCGYGRGFGGFGSNFGGNEKEFLQERKKNLEGQLKNIDSRLNDL